MKNNNIGVNLTKKAQGLHTEKYKNKLRKS